MYEHQKFVYVNVTHRIINRNDSHLLLIYVNNNFFQLNVLIVIGRWIFFATLKKKKKKEKSDIVRDIGIFMGWPQPQIDIPGNSYSFNVAFAALKYFKKPNSDGNKNNNARPWPDAKIFNKK